MSAHGTRGSNTGLQSIGPVHHLPRNRARGLSARKLVNLKTHDSIGARKSEWANGKRVRWLDIPPKDER